MTGTSELLRDLSFLLEICLVSGREEELDAFADRLIDRAVDTIGVINGLLFVRAAAMTASDATTATGAEHRFVALPARRTRFTMSGPLIDGVATGIEAALTTGRPTIRPGDDSAGARATAPGTPRPFAALSLPIRNLALLELYASEPGTLDEHTGAVLGTLVPWLEHQIMSRAEGGRARDELAHTRDRLAALERLLGDIPGVIWETGPGGGLVYIGSRCQAVLGIPPEALAGQSDLRSAGVRETDRARVAQEVSDSIAARRPEITLSYRFWRGGQPAAESLDIEERITSRFGADGELLGQVGCLCDVTVARAAQRRIEELNAQRTAVARADALRIDTQRTSRAKTEFLNLLSHELRAPLFPIIALSDLLLRLPDEQIHSGEWRQQVQMVAAAGKQMLQLVTDLLDISRVDAGKLRPNPGPINLGHFLDALGQRHADRARVLGAKLDLRVAPSAAGPDLYTDRSGLDRIAAALVAHALENLDSKRVHLEAGTTDTRVRMKLIADAPGPLAGDGEEIFEPFWERPGQARPESRGQGLALALVRRLAHALGGDVSAHQEGSSQVITVEIPCAHARTGSRLARPVHAVIGSLELSAVFELALTLQASGADVRVVSSVGELVDLVKQGAPDLLLIDARMPGMRVLEELLVIDRAGSSPHPYVVGLSKPGDALTLTGAIADEALPLPPRGGQVEKILARFN